MAIRNIKKLKTMAIIFALMLVIGTVYAMTIGAIAFNGNVEVFIPNGLDIFVNLDGTKQDDGNSWAEISRIDDTTFEVKARFVDWETGFSFPFDIENRGNLDIVITDVAVTTTTTDIIWFYIACDEDNFDSNYTDSNDGDLAYYLSAGYDIEINAGDTVEDFAFILGSTGKDSYSGNDSIIEDTVIFTIKINYELVD